MSRVISLFLCVILFLTLSFSVVEAATCTCDTTGGTCDSTTTTTGYCTSCNSGYFGANCDIFSFEDSNLQTWNDFAVCAACIAFFVIGFTCMCYGYHSHVIAEGQERQELLENIEKEKAQVEGEEEGERKEVDDAETCAHQEIVKTQVIEEEAIIEEQQQVTPEDQSQPTSGRIWPLEPQEQPMAFGGFNRHASWKHEAGKDRIPTGGFNSSGQEEASAPVQPAQAKTAKKAAPKKPGTNQPAAPQPKQSQPSPSPQQQYYTADHAPHHADPSPWKPAQHQVATIPSGGVTFAEGVAWMVPELRSQSQRQQEAPAPVSPRQKHRYPNPTQVPKDLDEITANPRGASMATTNSNWQNTPRSFSVPPLPLQTQQQFQQQPNYYVPPPQSMPPPQQQPRTGNEAFVADCVQGSRITIDQGDGTNEVKVSFSVPILNRGVSSHPSPAGYIDSYPNSATTTPRPQRPAASDSVSHIRTTNPTASQLPEPNNAQERNTAASQPRPLYRREENGQPSVSKAPTPVEKKETRSQSTSSVTEATQTRGVDTQSHLVQTTTPQPQEENAPAVVEFKPHQPKFQEGDIIRRNAFHPEILCDFGGTIQVVLCGERCNVTQCYPARGNGDVRDIHRYLVEGGEYAPDEDIEMLFVKEGNIYEGTLIGGQPPQLLTHHHDENEPSLQTYPPNRR